MPGAHSSAKTTNRRLTALPRRPVAAPNIATSATAEVGIGRRLRDLRAEHGLSLRALAECSGLNVNTLSLIENDKTSPSVSTLQQIAAALDVPIVALFETGAPKNSVTYIRADLRPRAAFAHGILEDLGVGMTDRAVEPFVVTLEPYAGSGSHPIVHTGFEFVFGLQGEIAYRIEEHTYMLEAGDSLLFESHLPHLWHNPTAQQSRAILVLCPTDARDRPTERHFMDRESWLPADDQA
jgi:transcriptional regulator with XRE-family HTH domain